MKAPTFYHESYKTHPVFMICILCSQCSVYFQKCIFITLGFTLNVLKDHPVLLLWIVIIVRVYWILTTTTITIRNHNIRILAPFRFRDPTSFQCFQTGKLGHYQNTKLAMIMIIKILVLLFGPDFSLHELLHVRMLQVYRYKVDFVCLAYQWPSYTLSGDRLVDAIEKFLLSWIRILYSLLWR